MKSFPRLFAKTLPTLNEFEVFTAPGLALVLQHTGEGERAKALLDRSEAYLRTIPRMGRLGYGIMDVAIHALRGDTSTALAKLREAEQAGWRAFWRYHRDYDPQLASIRNEPEFKAVFADIERDTSFRSSPWRTIVLAASATGSTASAFSAVVPYSPWPLTVPSPRMNA